MGHLDLRVNSNRVMQQGERLRCIATLLGLRGTAISFPTSDFVESTVALKKGRLARRGEGRN